MIKSDSVTPRERTLTTIQDVLEKAGVEFLGEDGKGAGVRQAY